MVKTEELRRQVLFEDIPQPQLEDLAKAVQKLSLKKGDLLFKDGEETKGIYLIEKGKIEIAKETADGWKQTLAVLGPFHFFGELSIMEKRSHEADAKAIEDTTLLKLGKEEFERIERENKDLALSIIKKIATVMSKNLRRMNDKFLNALINY